MADFNDEINNAFQTLKNGGVILYPTDTVWGIGCDSTNPEAVDEIFKIKKREASKSLIILVNNDSMLNRFVYTIPGIAWDIIDLAEKPTTIIYPKAQKTIAKNVTAEDGSIAARMVKDEFCDKLLQRFGKPIVSTSANLSGKSFPESFDAIDEEIKTAVDYVVKIRQTENTIIKPSSIIKLGPHGEVEIIRK